MSDRLTPRRPASSRPAPAPSTDGARARGGRLVVVAQALATVALFAAAGALCGWLWWSLWDAPTGTVSGGQWFTDETGLRADFSATGTYVAIAGGVGLVLGVVCAWFLDRAEVVTLAAVVVGATLAGWLMVQVGHHLSPADPDVLARTAADGTRLKGTLVVHGTTAGTAFPFAAIVGAMLVFYLTGRREPAAPAPAPADDPSAV